MGKIRNVNTLSIQSFMRNSKSHDSMKRFHTEAYQFASKRYFTVLSSLLRMGDHYKHYVRSEMDVIRKLDPNDRTWLNSAAGPRIIETLQLIRKTRASIAALHSRMFD